MLEDDILALAESALRPHAPTWSEGFEILRPEPLTVLRVASRSVRLHWVPYLGITRSVVLVARQPAEVDIARDGDATLVRRLALAATHAAPLRQAPAVVFTGIIVSPRPIDPEDEGRMANALEQPRTGRAIPLGLFRINASQEAVAFALRRGPAGLFPEPDALADAACQHLRRYVATVS